MKRKKERKNIKACFSQVSVLFKAKQSKERKTKKRKTRKEYVFLRAFFFFFLRCFKILTSVTFYGELYVQTTQMSPVQLSHSVSIFKVRYLFPFPFPSFPISFPLCLFLSCFFSFLSLRSNNTNELFVIVSSSIPPSFLSFLLFPSLRSLLSFVSLLPSFLSFYANP